MPKYHAAAPICYVFCFMRRMSDCKKDATRLWSTRFVRILEIMRGPMVFHHPETQELSKYTVSAFMELVSFIE